MWHNPNSGLCWRRRLDRDSGLRGRWKLYMKINGRGVAGIVIMRRNPARRHKIRGQPSNMRVALDERSICTSQFVVRICHPGSHLVGARATHDALSKWTGALYKLDD